MRHAVVHLKRSDPLLRAIIERVGPFRMPYREPIFETLVRAIAFQQLNGKAAKTIYDRLVAAAGGQITPESMLALTEEQMRACGLSMQKLRYIRDLAQRTASEDIDFTLLPQMSDEDVIAHLTRVKGIGVWSAQMFLMFALRRADVMPVADYGIRAAVMKAYRKRKLPNAATLEKISRPWRPYRSIACWYLWRSLDKTI